MTKFSIIGIISLIGGGLLVGFQALSVLMGTDGKWKSMKLITVFDKKYFEWIDNASFFGLERIPEYIVNMRLFILLLCVGVLFFALDYFFGKR